jgi:hypothetical protein
MPQPKRPIELRHGLALDPNPSRAAPTKFQSFERSLRELESAIGNALTMSKLRALLTSSVSPSHLDDHQVISHIAKMVTQGAVALVSWPGVVLFESGGKIGATLSVAAPAKSCKCFNAAAFAKKLDTDADGRTVSIGLCGRYVGLALIAGGATTVGLHNGGDYGPYLIKAGFAAVSAAGYSPQMGDVVIFSPTATHAAGHAAGFDGTQWVSDYLQRRANPYRIASSAGACTYYRIVCKCS